MEELRKASDELIQKLKEKEQRNDVIWELDMFHTDKTVKTDDFDEPFKPLVIILADQTTGGVIEHEILGPGDETEQIIYGMMVDIIDTYHRPNAIVIRNETILEVMTELLVKLEIRILNREHMMVIDELIRDLKRALQ